MLGLTGQSGKVVDFLIGAEIFGTNQQDDASLRIVRDQASDNRNCRVALLVDGEKNFVIGVILSAETRVVFVGREVNAVHGLQDTYGQFKCWNECWRGC